MVVLGEETKKITRTRILFTKGKDSFIRGILFFDNGVLFVLEEEFLFSIRMTFPIMESFSSNACTHALLLDVLTHHICYIEAIFYRKSFNKRRKYSSINFISSFDHHVFPYVCRVVTIRIIVQTFIQEQQ